MLGFSQVGTETKILLSGLTAVVGYGAAAYVLARIVKASAPAGIVLLVAGLVPVVSLLPQFVHETVFVFGTPWFRAGRLVIGEQGLVVVGGYGIIETEYDLRMHLIVAGTIGIVTGAVLLYRDLAARRSA